MNLIEKNEEIQRLEKIKKKSFKEKATLQKLKKEVSIEENETNNEETNKSSMFTSETRERMEYIDIDEIKDNPFQPRKHLRKEEILELSESIKEETLLQPISIVRVKEEIYLNIGQKRLKSFQLLNKKEKEVGLEPFEMEYNKIPAFVKKVDELEDLAGMSLAENLARKDPFVLDTAIALKNHFEILKTKKVVTKLSEYAEIAKRKFAIESKGTVSKYLKIAELPEEVKKEVFKKEFNSISILYHIAKNNDDVESKLTNLEKANKKEKSLKDFESESKKEKIPVDDDNKEAVKEKFPQETNEEGENEEEKFPQETNEEGRETKIKVKKIDKDYVLDTLRNIKETTDDDKDRLIDELIDYLDDK